MAKLEPTIYSEASAVKRIAQDLIEKHHPHLAKQRIEYLFSAKAKKTNGKSALGWVTIVSGLAAYFGQEASENASEVGEPFFCMVIHSGAWHFQLNSKQRVALVDHELCHLQVEKKYNKLGMLTETNLKLIGHDLEEFKAVVERHGVWLEDVEEFREALENCDPQLSFDLVSQPDSKAA